MGTTLPFIRPQVSVVIPCRNEAGTIERCLTSVLSQQAPEGGFEVIIADGMSEDGTREVLRKVESGDPRVMVIDNPGRIVSTGLNAAIRSALGQIIIRMDAHTDYAPDYLHQCVAVLQGTGADNVGGPWLAKGDRYLARAIAAAFQSPFSAGGAPGHNSSYEGSVDTVYLGCWRKEAFERFGYFDEELVRNQDDEHNLRIVRGGGKVWQSPEIKSWYRPRGSLRELFKQYMQYGYWKVPVIQKHKLPASIRHLVPGGFLLTLAVLLLLSVFSIQHLAFSISFLAVLGSYLLAVLVASVVTAAKTEWKLLPLLPLVFPCYHFGYAYGFLCGIWNFVIMGGSSNTKFKLLTR